MFNLNNLQIKPSPLLTVISLIILSCGVVVLYHVELPHYLYTMMVSIGFIITAHFIAKHTLLIFPNSIIRCDATEDALFLTQKNGKRIEAIPLSSTFSSTKLLLLSWKPLSNANTWKQALLQALFSRRNLTALTTENVSSQNDYRRLRVLLKFGKHSNASTTID